MGVVKANAYGHGLLQVSLFIQGAVDYLGVANAEEGAMLRRAGLASPIHVFTIPIRSQMELYADFDLEATICSEIEAEQLNSLGGRRRKNLPVHLKIDTGMNRIGVRPEGLVRFLGFLKKLKRLNVKGVYTHFASADQKDKTFSREQLSRFGGALDALRRLGVWPELIHCAGSAGILDLPESHHSMVRPGIMMYGYYPSRHTSESVRVTPALSLKSRVSFVKWIEAGESVSYGRRFVATKRTKIATIPIGYADGYPRLLTGKTEALIHGKRFPVIGTICMDQIMIDVGNRDVVVDDEVVLIGRQEKEKIDAWDLASRMGTIPYEICTNISSRVPRTYKGL